MAQYVRIGLVALGLVVVGLLSAGSYYVLAVKPNEPVAIVNGVPIRTRDYQVLVRYNRLNLEAQVDAVRRELLAIDPKGENAEHLRQFLQQQLQSLESSSAALPSQTLEQMIADELIRQEASRRGIGASEEELEREIEAFFGYPGPEAQAQATEAATPAAAQTPAAPTEEVTLSAETPTPEGSPTPTPTPFTQEAYLKLRADYLRYLQERAGLTEAQFRELMRVRVLERKLREAFAAEIPAVAPHVHLRQIVVGTEEQAKELEDRLARGEDFAALANEASQDESSKEQGGDLGWLPEGSTRLPQPVLEQAFALEVGKRATVSAWDGYHIIEVLERDEQRPLAEEERKQRQQRAFQDWLTAASYGPGVKRLWSQDKVPSS